MEQLRAFREETNRLIFMDLSHAVTMGETDKVKELLVEDQNHCSLTALA
jgi:hypothetical protein